MNTVDIETRIKVSSLSGKVGCIVGGSYESGRPQDTNNHLLKGGRYYSLCDMLKAVMPEVHWLNYAQAGSVSSGGIKQLEVAISQAKEVFFSPKTEIDFLVIGSFVHEYLWRSYDYRNISLMLKNIESIIHLAQKNGINRCIINDLPPPETMHYSVSMNIRQQVLSRSDEAQIIEQYRARFDGERFNKTEVVFIRDVWADTVTFGDDFDNIHPDWESQLRAARRIEDVLRKTISPAS